MRLLILAALVGCGGDLDQPWDLDHDRIVAIRANPPAILSGETSEIDGLVAAKGALTMERSPDQVIVAKPESLASALTFDNGKWIVTAPDEAALDAARTELGLEAGASVPLQLGVAYGETLFGLKSVALGNTAPNPVLGVMRIDGSEAPAPTTEIVVGKLVDVPLLVEANEDDDVNWLTSCGTMHDFDLPSAYLRVEVEDLTEGELAVVLRDPTGGVTWQVWPIRAE
ncbi:MAG: hypothetical protein H0V17_00555 [Deltaproteobacteria bacterium]|nr:hypothetical protein [Deltaproteobacteria bacterium]